MLRHWGFESLYQHVGLKLVRDRVGNLPWMYEEAKIGLRRVTDAAEHHRLLRKKLLEEISELFEALDADEGEEYDEFADVQEVLMTLAGLNGLDWGNVEETRRQKHLERGGLSIGTVHITGGKKEDL